MDRQTTHAEADLLHPLATLHWKHCNTWWDANKPTHCAVLQDKVAITTWSFKSCDVLHITSTKLWSWTTITLPYERMSLTTYHSKFITVGGCHPSTRECTDQLFTSDTGLKWEVSLPPMPTQRFSTSSVSTRSPEVLVVAGGLGLGGKEVDVVEVLLGNHWHTVDPLPTACYMMHSVLHDENIYFIGGDRQYDNIYTCSCSSLISSCEDSSHTMKTDRLLWSQFKAPSSFNVAVSYLSYLLSIDSMYIVRAYSSVTQSWVEATSTGDRKVKITDYVVAAVLPTGELVYTHGYGGVYRVKLSVCSFSQHGKFTSNVLSRLEAVMGVQIIPVLANCHSQLTTTSRVPEWGEWISLPDPRTAPGQYVVEVISQWSAGNGYHPPTWGHLLEVLRDVGLPQLSQQIGAFMKGDDEVLDKKGFLSVGEVNATYTGKAMEIKSDDLGIHVHLPDQDLPPGIPECPISVSVAVSGDFDFPGSSELVSGVFKLDSSLVPKKPVTLTMEHCASGENIHNLSFASSANTVPPFLYKYIHGGKFTATHGEIEIDEFCCYAILEKHGEEGFLSLYEKKYQVSLHCSKNPTIERPSCFTWSLFFSMVKNCSIFQRSVDKYFLKSDALVEQLSNVIVKFDKDSRDIALTLEGDRVEIQRGWFIISLVTCSIKKSHVDSYVDGQPPQFRLILMQNSDKNPEDLLHKFKFTGADPECYIKIFKPIAFGTSMGPTHTLHYKRYLSKIMKSKQSALQKDLTDDSHLRQIAEVLQDWEQKFDLFDLTFDPDVYNICNGRNKDNLILQRIEVLNLWRNKVVEPTYDNLLKICVQGGFRKSAEAIVSIANKM